MLILVFFLLNGVFGVSTQPKGVGNPENITVQVIDSKTVEVFWSTSWKNVERYDITYNPTENRVVSQAAGNSHSIILRELRPNTQYQVTVTAIVGGKNYKSRRLVFRTSADANDKLELEDKFSPTKATKSKKWHPQSPEPINPDPTAVGSKNTPPTSTTVRGVEIGLVLLALCVWIIAIALFFHRWGKIRMLLPYQPDYKTQQSLKVPGTGTTIVSGCTGNSNSQGQQEGPGCVQHLRWSSRYFDDTSTAKKCSPARRQLRPRVSSAVFPASPSYFYARTSADCDSPRMIRHAHSHNDFPTESIPLCQVNQPRSDTMRNVISIAVPVIASNVNEKAQSKKTGESKVSEPKKSNDDTITEFDDSEFFKRDKSDTCPCSLGRDDSSKNSFYYLQNVYQDRRSSEEREISENEKENKQKPSESKTRPRIDFVDVALPQPPSQECKPEQQSEKPKRYNRSSLKKQKVRLYEDPDSFGNVPIYEFECNNESHENAKPRKSKDPKSAEMRRKAFLRKISLQDTYVNYNQDYWLDYKKSQRFHKSIDLGYFVTDEMVEAETEMKKPDAKVESSDWPEQTTTNEQARFTAIREQPQLPLKFTSGENMKKCDSDPVIFPTTCTCANCRDGSEACQDSSDLLMDVMDKIDRKEMSCLHSFFLTSNDDIPLFLERNGLIETDFDILDEDREIGWSSNDGSERPNETETSEYKPRDFGIAIDLSSFYEIKLNNSAESESENAIKSKTFDCQGGEPFSEALPSTSGESDDFYNETDPLMVSESRRPRLPNFCSSSSPPKSSPD